MPASSNRGGGSNLRILWIPGGRKRHDKGVYQPTNKGIEHKHTQKKIEPWSFGSPKEHHEDNFSKTHDSTEEGTSSLVSSSILPTASATIGAVAIESELSEKGVKKMKYTSEISDKDECGCSRADGSSSGSPVSRVYDTATLLISEKKIGLEHKTRDFDSIERLDDLDGNFKDNKQRIPVSRKKYHITNLDVNKNKTDKNEKKKEKTVKCLYYTLMCCECSIS